jgi:hypothetical protein
MRNYLYGTDSDTSINNKKKFDENLDFNCLFLNNSLSLKTDVNVPTRGTGK